MKLINDDCLKALKELPNESVDLVLTDCPYKICGGGCSNGAYGNDPKGILNRHREYVPKKVVGKCQQGHMLEGTKHVSLYGILDDNNIQYTREGKLFKHNDILFKEWLPEAYRVLKDGSHCYIYISARNAKELQQEAENVGFKWQQTIVWEKGNSVVNKYYLNSFELILMFRKGRAKNINNLGTKNILKVPNIIGCKTHPTEKPVALNEILIANSTKEGECVLDMFMGSGSCGVACKHLNRDFIGIEIDEKYFNIAKERIENE